MSMTGKNAVAIAPDMKHAIDHRADAFAKLVRAVF
jgi:inosine/xanthosine triphosphate pyrophosphatase family protein